MKVSWSRQVRQLAGGLILIAGLLTLAVPGGAIDRNRDQPEAEAQGLVPDRERDQPDTRDRDGARLQLVPPRRQPRWRLGVDVDNLDTGARINRVVRGTAAWRSGLESRDLIVSVNGYQVGRVDGRLYDLGDELNLRADRRGHVRLLVWNHRNGELVNLDVRLDSDDPPTPRPHEGGISGQVTFRASIRTNDQAQIVVRLVDITDRFRDREVREVSVPFTGDLPVPFRLDVDPQQLEPQRRYALKAHLEVGGRRVLVSPAGRYPLGRLDTDNVEILLEPERFDRR